MTEFAHPERKSLLVKNTNHTMLAKSPSVVHNSKLNEKFCPPSNIARATFLQAVNDPKEYRYNRDVNNKLALFITATTYVYEVPPKKNECSDGVVSPTGWSA